MLPVASLFLSSHSLSISSNTCPWRAIATHPKEASVPLRVVGFHATSRFHSCHHYQAEAVLFLLPTHPSTFPQSWGVHPQASEVNPGVTCSLLSVPFQNEPSQTPT